MPRPVPGTALDFIWRKWDGTPHWHHEVVYLGSDEHGEWVGQRIGARAFRPGREVTLSSASVMLLPVDRHDWVLTLNDAPELTRVYIDVAWDVQWPDDGLPTAIDMDLDVVRRLDERGVYIDDEDEWAEHSVQMGYPVEVMAELEATAADLHRRVVAREKPFDDETADHWLGVLSDLD
ncbi:DUF402 domain-containing protein [Microbacterium stercoris]|uniref:YgaC family protein n=1 Tax=Microbacterium stercoris TaxID=2820289 RepID=A0A939QHM7_9MICO|nr:DUF402 domain-containing protein [Microbacterium stercoris]MBO3663097.1 YgaC family protein [Microbacterium stercoris]